MRLLLFCPVSPDTAEWRTSAFSRSGNQYLLGLLGGLAANGVTLEPVESYVPTPAWPRGPLWSNGGKVKLPDGTELLIRRYPNIPIVKVICISVNAAWRIIAWRPKGAGGAVVLCYNLTVPSGIILRIAAWIARRPLVFSVADINIPGQTVPNNAMTRLDWWQHLWVLPRSDALLVVSDEISKVLAPRVLSAHIPGGLPPGRLEAFSQALPDIELKKSTGSKFCVLLAGSLEEVNGIREFVAAAREAPEDTEFWIAGTGKLDHLATEAAAECANVRYFGFLDQTALFSLIRTADLVVNMRITSRLDSRFFFPGKLFEFIASSTLTATTDVGPLVKEFGDVIVSIDDDTTAGLLDAILRARAIPSTLRRSMGEAARDRMAKGYSWSGLGAKARVLLEEVSQRAQRKVARSHSDSHGDDTAHGVR